MRHLMMAMFGGGLLMLAIIHCGVVKDPHEATRHRQLPDFRWSSWLIRCAAVISTGELPAQESQSAADSEKDGMGMMQAMQDEESGAASKAEMKKKMQEKMKEKVGGPPE